MQKEPIAIVGMGCFYPGSQDYSKYWNNLLGTNCFITEVPEDFWKVEDFYEEKVNDMDKTYSKKAGVLDPIDFDPVEFGIPPKKMESISVDQLFGLAVARQALIDAGLYGKDAKQFNRKKAGVIVSASVGKNLFDLFCRTNTPSIVQLLKNFNLPDGLVDKIAARYKEQFVDWDEASNPGYLCNVVAGRIANRFDLSGTNFNCDAACGSGLASVKLACQELWLGNCDTMLAGAIMLDISTLAFVSFCRTPALSKSDKIKPYDENSDGMLLGDGAGMFVLKRLTDAEACNDKIYAVIEGIGSSSDGKGSIFAPVKAGQMLAIERSLASANLQPNKIGLVEGHGTGTPVGDSCEVEALSSIFNKENKKERSIVLGSVKGQIGHLRLSAGIAGLMRAALSVYHKQFVPTIGCEHWNKAVENSNMYICDKPLPWIVNDNYPERYACVSAFGFGGTNFNVIIKEYKSDHEEPYRYTKVPQGVLIEGKDKEALKKNINDYIEKINATSFESIYKEYTYRELNPNNARLSFVAKDTAQALKVANEALQELDKQEGKYFSKKGITYSEKALTQLSKVTVLFPGQGSQYLNMLSNVTGAYPEMRKAFTAADNEMIKCGNKPISSVVYPKAKYETEVADVDDTLVKTQYTQPALAAVEAGLFDIMRKRGFSTDFVIGHSFGELVALYAAGVFKKEELMSLSALRGKYMNECTGAQKTGMTAMLTDKETVLQIIKPYSNVYLANENSPKQTIISGKIEELEKVEKIAEGKGIVTKRLKVSSAFHTPYMEKARESFLHAIDSKKFKESKVIVYSNYTSKAYNGLDSISENLTKQLVNPVLFESCVKNAYNAGSRIFVEIGAGHVLSKILKDCLADKDDYVIVTVNESNSKDSLEQFEAAMTSLAALGMPIKEDPYYMGINQEVYVKNRSTCYKIPATQFYLDETKKRINNARYSRVELDELVPFGVDSRYRVEEEDEMIKYNSLCEMNKIDASVFENYIKAQNNMLAQVNEILNNEKIDSVDNQRMVFDFAMNFQNNSYHALRSYFGDQRATLGGQADYFEKDDAVVMDVDVIHEDEMKEVAVTQTATTKQPSAPANTKTDKKKITNKDIDVKEMIIEEIVKVTGYPKEMVEPDMEIETDLGIDSINRMILLSNLNDRLGGIFSKDDASKLTAITTIQDCIDAIEKQLG